MFPGGKFQLAIAAAALAFSAPATPAFGQAGSNEAVLAFHPAPGDETKYQRHFYFHRAGVPLETARADIAECSAYAGSAILWARIPERVPAGGEDGRPVLGGSGMMGPIAAQVAFDLASGPEQRKIVGANLRKCMGFKGYRRYALSEPLWKWLNSGTPAEATERQARIASGAAPGAKWLDP